MAAVDITLSESIKISTAAPTPIADSILVAQSGLDLGKCQNGQYAPIVSKSGNTGVKHVYIAHNATVDPITDVGTFIDEAAAGSGGSYGGSDTAADDFTTMKTLGTASDGSKNNNTGLSGGLRIDMDALSLGNATQFDFDTNGFDLSPSTSGSSTVAIYGDRNLDGIDPGSAFDLKTNALVRDNAGVETAATAPVLGKIGKADDFVLGDNAHIGLRIYIPLATTLPQAFFQFDFVVVYAFTS